MTWDFPTAVKRVEFSEDGTQLLAVTEKRMGHLGTIVVFDITVDINAEQTREPSLRIVCEESKATVAGWSYLSRYIIAGHEDGSVSQYDGKASRFAMLLRSHGTANLWFNQTGEQLYSVQAHDADLQINDIQWAPDRTYFITAAKDKTAKVPGFILYLPCFFLLNNWP